MQWPVEIGTCANPACGKRYEPYINQRYCTPACRFAAMAARQALRAVR